MARLLFIHGAGCTPELWRHQRDAFPDALMPALPGHGIPGSPRSIAEFANAIEQTLGEESVRDVVLAGCSMGGAIALEVALRKHPAVRGVVLLGSSAKLRVAPAIFEAIDRDFPEAARMLAGLYFADPSQERVDAQVEQALAVGAPQTRRDFEACNAFDVLERLTEVDVPLLALSGELDRLVPPKFSQAAADRVPRGEARIVPGAGHLLNIERPAETNEALRAFVHRVVS